MLRTVLLSGMIFTLGACGGQGVPDTDGAVPDTNVEKRIPSEDLAWLLEYTQSGSTYDRLETDLPIVEWVEAELQAENDFGAADV